MEIERREWGTSQCHASNACVACNTCNACNACNACALFFPPSTVNETLPFRFTVHMVVPWVAGGVQGAQLERIPCRDETGSAQVSFYCSYCCRQLRRLKDAYNLLVQNNSTRLVIAESAGCAEVSGPQGEW